MKITTKNHYKVMENVVLTPRKKIRIRRALILGNFYNRAVEIVQAGTMGEESFVETIIGITSDSLLTREGRRIKLTSIQTIYQL